MESAQKAVKYGYWAAIIVAIVTAIFSTIAMAAQKKIATIDGTAYLDAALFAFIAWRIKKYSKMFAVIGVVLFLIEKILLIKTMGGAGLFQAVFVMVLFINGVRGVFAYHRLLWQSQSVDGNMNAAP
ncbi:hypothetical protein [Collimonas arenae]|uniref:hypothetical protein n=1 Tax=Collimonas arenae TaxID=279058 RepID=UPI0006907065|nr:hypothetical protein [Collimonas arenae]